MFDDYTNQIFMRALNEEAAPRIPPVGVNRSYRRTAPKPRQYRQQTSVPQYITRTPRPASPGTWYGTDTSRPTELGAMYMPGPDAYADPRTQVAYGKYKQMVDPIADYVFGVFGGIPGQLVGYGTKQFTNDAIRRLAIKKAQQGQKLSRLNKMLGDFAQSAAPGFAQKLVSTAVNNPVTLYATKQMVKADLANRYLGGGDLEDYKLDIISNDLGLNDSEKDVAKTYASIVKEQIPVIGNTRQSSEQQASAQSTAELDIAEKIPGVVKTMNPALLGGRLPTTTTKDPSRPKVQDPIMKALSDKIPDLVKMGVDPLDWITKLLGADEAAASMENIGNRARSVKSAGGYLIPGQQKGIY